VGKLPETDSHAPGHVRGGLVLLTLSTAAFLMTLDSSVMNVSMPQVAHDVDTSITGIQTAITLYTLVMATTMITGGKIGTNIGRRRAFAIGCVIYGAGSFVTSIATNLPVLIFGWSLLEGLGAALILPATVALVAGNFGPERRTRAYGLIAASGAIAVAVGPLIGGIATTYFSWRWVFAGEVLIVLVILVLSRRIAETPVDHRARLDYIGAILSALGLGLAVFGLLRSDEWGWVKPNVGAPSILGLSATVWLIVVGLVVVWLFFLWEWRVVAAGREPLLQPNMLRNRTLTSGLTMLLFQFLIQAGVFFVVPLFLSVVLELSAIETGLRVMPLSVSLLMAALGIPRLWPRASPRRVVRIGVLLLLSGILVLMSGIDVGASAAVVAMPMFLIGLGIGCLASQLGAVTVSAFPDEQSGEVGGLQNTATNLGASLGTALAGSVLITILSASAIAGIQQNNQVPADVRAQASVELVSGVPFLSDTQLRHAMTEAGAPVQITDSVVGVNAQARVEGLHAALALLAVLAVVSLFFTGGIPTMPPGGSVGSPDGRSSVAPAAFE
jgi:EmrB/QacA subfamily drug resistance transporter